MTAPPPARTGTTDPRARDDGLGWVTRALFPDPRVRLTIGPSGGSRGTDTPAGWRRVARYAVVPSVDRARFLLPLGGPRVTAAALLAYNALRPRRVRAVRAVLGAVARTGVLELGPLPLPVLTVAVPADVPPADLVLTAHLGAEIGADLVAGCGVRPPDPNHKPTLQLFDPAGHPRGYAKIGWNDATQDLVRTETAVLRRLPRPAEGSDYPLVPGLLTAGEWSGRTVAVIAPLPDGVRGLDPATPPRLDAMLAVARRGGPPAPRRPLAGSAFLARLTAEATAAASGAGTAMAGGVRALAAVRRLGGRYGETLVEFGDWHGDWVPWNLGTHRGRLVAWDWEHSAPDVPVGFDLAHEAFQRALILRARPVPEAVRAVTDHLDRYADRLGLGERQRCLLVEGYLIEMWLRTWRLARGGGGWNESLHPALLDEVEKRHVDKRQKD